MRECTGFSPSERLSWPTPRCACSRSPTGARTAPHGRIGEWEWATYATRERDLRPAAGRKDLDARTKWFYQAQIELPAMFRRDAHAGSLYWLGDTRQNGRLDLDGGKTYRLAVPLPAPAKLFWSITMHDPENRSEILTES